MKKYAIPVVATAAVVLILIIAVIATYNSLVTMREKVKESYATMEIQLQRRADLIPILVSTVQGYSVHEREIIQAVVDARARLAGSSSDNERIDAENELSGALSRLLVVLENYPDLKADANFRQLMDELAGTENRIATARRDYNEAVRTYNTRIQTFPGNMFAGLFGFELAPYYEVPSGSEFVPIVNF